MSTQSDKAPIIHTLLLTTGKLIYYEIGKAKNTEPPIIMLHGLGGDHRGLLPIARHLNKHVILIDLPGFGQSDELPLHSVAAYTAALEKVIDQAGSKPVIFGHSLGSALAVALAANVKDKAVGLVLLNPVPKIRRGIVVAMDSIYTVSGKLKEPYANRVLHSRIFDAATFALHQRRFSTKYFKEYVKLQQSTKYSVRAWREASAATNKCDQFAKAAMVQVPTLVLHGERDSMIALKTAQEFTAKFVMGQLRVLKGTGHFAHAEVPAKVASILTDFVNGLPRS